MIATNKMIVGRIYADCNPSPGAELIISYLMYVGRTGRGESMKQNFIIMAGIRSYGDVGEHVDFYGPQDWFVPSKKQLKEIFLKDV